MLTGKYVKIIKWHRIILYYTLIVMAVICIFVYIMCRTNTVYTDGFSKSEFHRIPIGATAQQVLDKLGHPFDAICERKKTGDFYYSYENASIHDIFREASYNSPDVFWLHYSKSYDGNSNFRCFYIAISNGVVIAKDTGIYFD